MREFDLLELALLDAERLGPAELELLEAERLESESERLESESELLGPESEVLEWLELGLPGLELLEWLESELLETETVGAASMLTCVTQSTVFIVKYTYRVLDTSIPSIDGISISIDSSFWQIFLTERVDSAALSPSGTRRRPP